ncbi:MAG TPA: PAS domain S-box protein, partial [Geminicoccaceae bacterium]|nr:PAS domain S-box protein [Geminicoccaceae bacterium]
MSTSLTEIRTPAIAAEDRPPRRASAAERRARQQAIVARLGLRALEGEAAPALMDRAVDGLRGGLDVEFAEVLQLLPDGDRLLLRAGAGWRDGLVGRATVSGGTESQAGFTIQAGEPVILQDLRRETRFRGPPLLLEHGVVSGLSVVIPGRGRPYGVLGAHTARRRRFSHHDAHFVQAAANVLAGAIERERGERELRESERRYRTLLERANDAIFVYPLDPEGRPGRYSEVNEVACRRLGYSREELLRLSPAEVVDRGDEPYALVLHRLREGGSVVFERHQIAKDGRRIPVEISATLLELGGGPAVVAIARDVTERKRAEAALRESEERLRFTIEAARVGTWDWDMTTGHVRWSDNLEAIHGLPPGSFGGDFESVLADVHPDDRDRVMEAVQRTAGGGDGHYHVEYRLPAREGVGERWVEGKGRTIRDPQTGRPVRMAGICMDVTERKRAERTLELLVGELQHRVKNVLAVVQSLAAQTLRTAGSPEAFSEAFQGRLAGLAEAHRLLAGTNWEGTGLRELVMAELAPWQQDGRGGDDRIRLAG